jgi:hypothetical protein
MTTLSLRNPLLESSNALRHRANPEGQQRRTPVAFAPRDVHQKTEQAMHATNVTTNRGKRFMPRATWEKQMDTSTENILETLEQNANWWEQAAATCEGPITQLASNSKEEWQLMAAVYRERANKLTHLLEQLRHKTNGAHG